jgi:hypothetical protein
MTPIALPALEEFISGDEAAAQLGISYRTYKRYYLDGVNGVRLRTVLAGGRKRKTTLRWIEQFIAEVNAAEVAFLTPCIAQGSWESRCERLHW